MRASTALRAEFRGQYPSCILAQTSAATGAIFPVTMIAAVIYRGQKVVGPRLRRPLFAVNPPIGVTGNHGRAEWMTIKQANKQFPGFNPEFGGIVVGEAYRVDQDKVADRRCYLEKVGARRRSAATDRPVPGGTNPLLDGHRQRRLQNNDRNSDVAGEIAPMLHPAREGMGHKVYEIETSTNIGFNVLDWIDTKSPLCDTNIDSVVS